MPGFTMFWPGDSLWHRLDPRSKSLTLLLLILLLMRIDNDMVLAALLIMVLAAALLSGIPLRVYVINLRAFMLLIILTMALQAWSGWGVEPGLPGQVDGAAIMSSVQLGARLLAMVLAALMFSLTTSPAALIDAGGRLMNPLRRLGLPVEELQMVMYIAYRFLPLLLQEGQFINEAQLSRGISVNSGPFLRRWTGRLALVVPLLSRALDAAEQLAESLEARGYQPGLRRSHLYHGRLGRWDYVLMAASLVLFGGVMLL